MLISTAPPGRKPSEPTMESEIQRFQATFARLVAEGADTVRIADAAVLTWLGIEAALSPVIGQRGVAALYKRSLFLARKDHPWLTAVYEGAQAPVDFAKLATAMLQQTVSSAVGANSALLQTFYDLLANLIGEALTRRLLQSVVEQPSNAYPMEDTSP